MQSDRMGLAVEDRYVTSSESPTHPDAPRAGGETPDILAELDRYLDAYRDAIIAEQYAGPEDAATDPDVDRAWERAMHIGDAFRASLLERHRDGEREPLGVPRDAVQCDWCHAIFALEYATDDGLCTFCGGCTYALSVILATASAGPSPERASAISATPSAASPEPSDTQRLAALTAENERLRERLRLVDRIAAGLPSSRETTDG